MVRIIEALYYTRLLSVYHSFLFQRTVAGFSLVALLEQEWIGILVFRTNTRLLDKQYEEQRVIPLMVELIVD